MAITWIVILCTCFSLCNGFLQSTQDSGCGTITASAGNPYRFASKNPATVAPVYMDWEVKSYSNPLLAELKDSSLVIAAPADMVANFNLVNSTNISNISGNGERYLLQSIQIRKPGQTAEGLGQALNHELEVVLVHKEITGTGYYANVIVPFEVGVDPGFQILAPLLNEAELPQNVGEIKPVLVTNTLPLDLAAVFENASFQEFWSTVETSCQDKTAGSRFIMRNATLMTSKDIMGRLLSVLKWAEESPALKAPTPTWLMGACSRGRTCKLFTSQDLDDVYNKAKNESSSSYDKLLAAKTAMDDALVPLIRNESKSTNDSNSSSIYNSSNTSTGITNADYDNAVAARETLRNAEAAYLEAAQLTKDFEVQINASKRSTWDSDKPASANSSNTTAASLSSTAASRSSSSSTAGASSLLGTADCTTGGLTALDADLAKDAEHVDASKAGTSEAVLFWRLSSNPLPAAEAAAAETAAETPLLHLANLGNKLRISMADQGKPFIVLYVHGQELPASYADVTVPALHAKDGKRPAAEIQIVHVPSSGRAVAVGLQLDEVDGDGNTFLDSLLQGLPGSGEVGEVHGADPMTLHGALGRGVAGRYFRYHGLLEGVPCGVSWHILEERGRISSQQLVELHKVMQPPGTPSNVRGPTALRISMLAKDETEVEAVSMSSKVRLQRPREAKVEPITPSAASPNLKSLLLSLPRQQRAQETGMAL